MKQFQAKEADILGGKEEYLQKINFETEQKLAEMNARVQQKEQLVINDLVAQVYASYYYDSQFMTHNLWLIIYDSSVLIRVQELMSTVVL